MNIEVRAWYRNTMSGTSRIDKELSAPKHEVPDDMAYQMMACLESIGLKKHESHSHLWYEKITDCLQIRR